MLWVSVCHWHLLTWNLYVVVLHCFLGAPLNWNEDLITNRQLAIPRPQIFLRFGAIFWKSTIKIPLIKVPPDNVGECILMGSEPGLERWQGNKTFHSTTTFQIPPGLLTLPMYLTVYASHSTVFMYLYSQEALAFRFEESWFDNGVWPAPS